MRCSPASNRQRDSFGTTSVVLHGAFNIGGISPSVSLVLASREAKVDRAVDQAFGKLGTRRVSGSSGAGFASGRSAADRTSLGGPGLKGPGGAVGPGHP